MAILLNVPAQPTVKVRICDVRVSEENLAFEAEVDEDGDIRIEISEEDFIRIAKNVYGLVEATDD